MAVTSTPAAAIIDEMIRSNEAQIALANEMLAGYLYELDHHIAIVRDHLENELNIDSNWIREGAHKVEEQIAKRRYHYEQRASLEYVRKAADPV
jgi:hypothetical protein